MTTKSAWEIYEEPKPKQTVMIEKWLINCGNGFFIHEGDKEFLVILGTSVKNSLTLTR